MYMIVKLHDIIALPPTDFPKPSARAIEDYLNTKYTDKVLHKVGLCIAFHSLLTTSEGLIGHGTGTVHINVDFKLLVFRPRKGEILPGVIATSSPLEPYAGIWLDMDFFEDVHVPPGLLFDGTTWKRDEYGTDAWVWEEGGNEFYFDRAEVCLWRVENEEWRDLSPQMVRPGGGVGGEEEEGDEGRKIPFLVQGSMGLSGLGPTLWWQAEEGDGEGEDDEDDFEGDDEGMNGHANGVVNGH